MVCFTTTKLVPKIWIWHPKLDPNFNTAASISPLLLRLTTVWKWLSISIPCSIKLFLVRTELRKNGSSTKSNNQRPSFFLSQQNTLTWLVKHSSLHMTAMDAYSDIYQFGANTVWNDIHCPNLKFSFPVSYKISTLSWHQFFWWNSFRWFGCVQCFIFSHILVIEDGIAKLHKRDCYKMTVAKILLNGQIYSKVYIGSSKIDEKCGSFAII